MHVQRGVACTSRICNWLSDATSNISDDKGVLIGVGETVVFLQLRRVDKGQVVRVKYIGGTAGQPQVDDGCGIALTAWWLYCAHDADISLPIISKVRAPKVLLPGGRYGINHKSQVLHATSDRCHEHVRCEHCGRVLQVTCVCMIHWLWEGGWSSKQWHPQQECQQIGTNDKVRAFHCFIQ